MLFVFFVFVFANYVQPPPSTSNHTNNWAVIVAASRYWFNYRHISNALAVYHTLKSNGIPDSQIILMLADDMACNPRNSLKPHVFIEKNENIGKRTDLYGSDVLVDYRGLDCSVENLIRVLSGRHSPSTPKTKRLDTDDNSNILVYLTGHGGENFLKFHDKEEIQSQDLADVFMMMHNQKRYNEILFVADTCQAASMGSAFTAPNVISMASSQVGESSYSYGLDSFVGLSTSDRFTYHILQFFKRGIGGKRGYLKALMNSMNPEKLLSTHSCDHHLLERDFDEVKITDFFAATNNVHLYDESYDVQLKACKRLKEESPKLTTWSVNREETSRIKSLHSTNWTSVLLFVVLAALAVYDKVS